MNIEMRTFLSPIALLAVINLTSCYEGHPPLVGYLSSTDEALYHVEYYVQEMADQVPMAAVSEDLKDHFHVRFYETQQDQKRGHLAAHATVNKATGVIALVIRGSQHTGPLDGDSVITSQAIGKQYEAWLKEFADGPLVGSTTQPDRPEPAVE